MLDRAHPPEGHPGLEPDRRVSAFLLQERLVERQGFFEQRAAYLLQVRLRG